MHVAKAISDILYHLHPTTGLTPYPTRLGPPPRISAPTFTCRPPPLCASPHLRVPAPTTRASPHQRAPPSSHACWLPCVPAPMHAGYHARRLPPMRATLLPCAPPSSHARRPLLTWAALLLCVPALIRKPWLSSTRPILHSCAVSILMPHCLSLIEIG